MKFWVKKVHSFSIYDFLINFLDVDTYKVCMENFSIFKNSPKIQRSTSAAENLVLVFFSTCSFDLSWFRSNRRRRVEKVPLLDDSYHTTSKSKLLRCLEKKLSEEERNMYPEKLQHVIVDGFY